ncbi:MAG: TadE-like protein [Chloroflexota bacterium]|nr:TadE-like protein [Chloroflexota bacterium]
MTKRHVSVKSKEAGQGLVEFALVLPIFLLLLLIMFEFGFAYNHNLTLGLASREGARTGAALANGGVVSCAGGNDPMQVDANIVAGLQRILKSPGSDVVMSDISSVRIFKADATGAQIGSFVNVWAYAGVGSGPDVDPGAGVEKIDFTQSSVAWPACSRLNGGSPDSIGVQIRYTYRLVTPLAGIVSFLRGNQPITIAMNDQTVMVLNPTS